MSDRIREVLDQMDSKVVLHAFQGCLGTKSPESEAAVEKLIKAFEKADVDCGPQGCRSGFVQRKLLNYAGENMLRELHQKVAQSEDA